MTGELIKLKIFHSSLSSSQSIFLQCVQLILHLKHIDDYTRNDQIDHDHRHTFTL